MLRLKLERYDTVRDDKGYISEVNRQECIEFSVDPSEGDPDYAFAKLVSVLREFLNVPKPETKP